MKSSKATTGNALPPSQSDFSHVVKFPPGFCATPFCRRKEKSKCDT
jgi:hypothetical protein